MKVGGGGAHFKRNSPPGSKRISAPVCPFICCCTISLQLHAAASCYSCDNKDRFILTALLFFVSSMTKIMTTTTTTAMCLRLLAFDLVICAWNALSPPSINNSVHHLCALLSTRSICSLSLLLLLSLCDGNLRRLIAATFISEILSNDGIFSSAPIWR